MLRLATMTRMLLQQRPLASSVSVPARCAAAASSSSSSSSSSTSPASTAPSRADWRTAFGGQDRIGTDGALVGDPNGPTHRLTTPGGGLALVSASVSAAGGSAAPPAPPLSATDLDALVEFVGSASRLLVLTGAGASTESGVPDYRSPGGAYSSGFKPMTVQTFMSGPQARARYWARSFAGYEPFAATRPNAAHAALAGLQARGWLGGGLVTQNVDRLHHRAGSRGVIELHGTTHVVRCLGCGHKQDRAVFQETLAALNPAAADAANRMNAAAAEAKARRSAMTAVRTAACGASLEESTPEDSAARNRMIQDHIREDGPLDIPVQRPDGDTEIVDAGVGFSVPPCAVCGTGTLMPDVVFFGDSLCKTVAAAAAAAASACDAMLVVGSSLTVYSAFRLAKAAKDNGAGLAIVNVGATRADELSDLKIEARAGEALPLLAATGPLRLPRF